MTNRSQEAPLTGTRASTDPSDKELSSSVIICTYNRGMVLFDTIEMVMANDHTDFELIVVDQTLNPDTDYQTRLTELQNSFDFQYITLPEPSLTFARNVGIQCASGDIVIFIDDDVELESNFVVNHLRPYVDPDVGAIAGRVFDIKYDTDPPDGPTGRLRPDGSITINYHATEPQEVDCGRGCNMSFRRNALVEVGAFDERYIGSAFREDNDPFFRMKQQGHKVLFEPAASLIHLESDGGLRTDTGRKNLKRQFHTFRGDALFYMNCKDFTRIDISVPSYLQRRARWAYAVKKKRGYSWKDFFYLIGGFLSGIKAHYIEDPHWLSKKHGFELGAERSTSTS